MGGASRPAGIDVRGGASAWNARSSFAFYMKNAYRWLVLGHKLPGKFQKDMLADPSEKSREAFYSPEIHTHSTPSMSVTCLWDSQARPCDQILPSFDRKNLFWPTAGESCSPSR